MKVSVRMLPPPRFSINGTTARVRPTSEYALTSSAIRKLSRDVSTNGLCSASAGAKPAPCTAKSSPPNSRSRPAARSAICWSLVTSHGRTTGFTSVAASSRTFSSSRSLGYVSARRAPAAAAACAIAHEMERLLATPTMRPCLPMRSHMEAESLTLTGVSSQLSASSCQLFRALAARAAAAAHALLRPTAAARPHAAGRPGGVAVSAVAAEWLAAGQAPLVPRAEAILTAGRLSDGEFGNRARWWRLALVARQGCPDQRAMDGSLFLVAAVVLGFRFVRN